MAKDKLKLSDFRSQSKNGNRHTVRGMGLLSHSIGKNGVIGAMTVAADYETFDGSATWETCVDTFGEDVEPIIVRSKGDRPIIHIREDIPTADDPRAKELGIAANRVAEVNLDYDLEVLAELHEEVGLEDMFFADEIEALMGKENQDDEGGTEYQGEKSVEEKKPTSSDDDYSVFELIMIHDNKLYLLETLNKVKEKFLYDKQEDALMQILREFNDGY